MRSYQWRDYAGEWVVVSENGLFIEAFRADADDPRWTVLQALLESGQATIDGNLSTGRMIETELPKPQIFRRLIDAEYPVYEAIRATFPPRVASIFDAATVVSVFDEWWPALADATKQAFGEARAREILFPLLGPLPDVALPNDDVE